LAGVVGDVGVIIGIVPVVGVVHRAEVVNVHVKSAARELPKVSAAPVLMVAVKVALGARATEGVKVAILVAAT
jgi:hypothetical protein